MARLVPTLSLDSTWLLERDAAWFGKATRQTLEPRMLYVNTPYRRQDGLPNFDLVGIRAHLKHHLVADLVDVRALLGDERGLDDTVFRPHAATRSLMRSSAARVTTRWW